MKTKSKVFLLMCYYWCFIVGDYWC